MLQKESAALRAMPGTTLTPVRRRRWTSEVRAQEGVQAPSDPAAPNLVSTSTAAQAGKVDTDAMETEENKPAVFSQAPAIATSVEPSVTEVMRPMEQEGPESKRQRTVAGLSVCSLLTCCHT